LSDAELERGVDTVSEIAVRCAPFDASLTVPKALFCPVGPSPPDCCCIGCSDPVHTTGPVVPEVETLAVGAVAAVSPTGFALAHAARPIRDAGRHTSLSFIEILY
jgi:hypothetical protein